MAPGLLFFCIGGRAFILGLHCCCMPTLHGPRPSTSRLWCEAVACHLPPAASVCRLPCAACCLSPLTCRLPPAACPAPPAADRLPPAACLPAACCCRLPLAAFRLRAYRLPVCRLLSAACRVTRAATCGLPGACCVSPAACRLPPAACRLLRAGRRLPPAACHLLAAACHQPPAACACRVRCVPCPWPCNVT